jgi:hypothetical protein
MYFHSASLTSALASMIFPPLFAVSSCASSATRSFGRWHLVSFRVWMPALKKNFRNAPIGCRNGIEMLNLFQMTREVVALPAIFRASRGRDPAAVSRLVVAVVVDAVEVLSGRAFAHVGEKLAERFSPLVTNFDTAPAIAGVTGGFWPVAPRYHRVPSAVERMVS